MACGRQLLPMPIPVPYCGKTVARNRLPCARERPPHDAGVEGASHTPRVRAHRGAAWRHLLRGDQTHGMNPSGPLSSKPRNRDPGAGPVGCKQASNFDQRLPILCASGAYNLVRLRRRYGLKSGLAVRKKAGSVARSGLDLQPREVYYGIGNIHWSAPGIGSAAKK